MYDPFCRLRLLAENLDVDDKENFNLLKTRAKNYMEDAT